MSISILQDELASLDQLIDVLREEHECLVAGEVETLGRISARKSKIVQNLNSSASERKQAMLASKYALNAEGAMGWAENQCGTAGSAIWKSLLAQGADAKERNRVNGLLILRRQRDTHARLDALRGGSAGTYDPTGKTSSPLGSRTLSLG